MDSHAWVNTGIALLSLLVTGLLLPIFNHLKQIRHNELEHIDKKLDVIEGKLDRHLEWHSEKK